LAILDITEIFPIAEIWNSSIHQASSSDNHSHILSIRHIRQVLSHEHFVKTKILHSNMHVRGKRKLQGDHNANVKMLNNRTKPKFSLLRPQFESHMTRHRLFYSCDYQQRVWQWSPSLTQCQHAEMRIVSMIRWYSKHNKYRAINKWAQPKLIKIEHESKIKLMLWIFSFLIEMNHIIFCDL
jgi:hypothetical protein